MEYVNDNSPLKSPPIYIYYIIYIILYILYYIYYIIYIILYACICRLNMWVNTCYCGFVDLAIAAHVLKDSASHSECHRKDSCMILHDTAWILHIINAQLQDWRIGQIMFQQDSHRYRNPFGCLWMQPMGPMAPRHFLEGNRPKDWNPIGISSNHNKRDIGDWCCAIVTNYVYIYIYTYYIILCMYIYIDIVYFSNHIYITLQPASPRCRSRNRSPACEETTWSSLQASRSQRPCSSKAEPSEKATCSCLPGGWWRMATKIVGS